MEQYDSWKVQRVREGQRKLEKVRGGGKVCTVMHADLTEHRIIVIIEALTLFMESTD